MRISKYNPEITLRIIWWSKSGRPSVWTYGVKAVERRIKRCCADNPDCKKADECYYQYVKFVNTTENPKEPDRDKYKRPKPSVVETYKLHGIILNEDMVRC